VVAGLVVAEVVALDLDVLAALVAIALVAAVVAEHAAELAAPLDLDAAPLDLDVLAALVAAPLVAIALVADGAKHLGGCPDTCRKMLRLRVLRRRCFALTWRMDRLT
jgi:hypothetical protein